MIQVAGDVPYRRPLAGVLTQVVVEDASAAYVPQRAGMLLDPQVRAPDTRAEQSRLQADALFRLPHCGLLELLRDHVVRQHVCKAHTLLDPELVPLDLLHVVLADVGVQQRNVSLDLLAELDFTLHFDAFLVHVYSFDHLGVVVLEAAVGPRSKELLLLCPVLVGTDQVLLVQVLRVVDVSEGVDVWPEPLGSLTSVGDPLRVLLEVRDRGALVVG